MLFSVLKCSRLPDSISPSVINTIYNVQSGQRLMRRSLFCIHEAQKCSDYDAFVLTEELLK